MKGVTIFLWIRIIFGFMRSIIHLLFLFEWAYTGKCRNKLNLWWWAEGQIGSEGAQWSMWWRANRSRRLMDLKQLITLCIRHHALKTLHIMWKVTASLDKIPSGAVYIDSPKGTFELLVKGQASEFWRKRA